jgi:putative endonuclease
MSAYFVYILECRDGSYYTGITTDVARRFAEHAAGTGGKYTRSRAPERVVYTEARPDRSSAQKWEAEIKRLPRHRKAELARSGIVY